MNGNRGIDCVACRPNQWTRWVAIVVPLSAVVEDWGNEYQAVICKNRRVPTGRVGS